MQSEKRQKIVYSEPREIHEISKITYGRQITIPRTLANILEISRGDKIYWIKSRKKHHFPETYDITIRVIHTNEGT